MSLMNGMPHMFLTWWLGPPIGTFRPYFISEKIFPEIEGFALRWTYLTSIIKVSGLSCFSQ